MPPKTRLLTHLLLLCTLLGALPPSVVQAQGSGQGASSNSLDHALRALGGSVLGSPPVGGPVPPGSQPLHSQNLFPQSQSPAAPSSNHTLRRAVDHLRPLDPCLDPKGCPKQVVRQVQEVVNQLAGPTGQEVQHQLSATQTQVTATSTAVQAAVTAAQAAVTASQAGAVAVVGVAATNSQPLIDVAVQQLTASQAQLKTLVQDLGSRLDVAAELVRVLENEPPGTLPLSLKYLITGQVNDSIVFAQTQAQKLGQRLAEVEQALAQAQQAAAAAAAAIGTAGQQQAQAEAARAAELAAQLQQTLLNELKPVQQQLDATAQTLQQALDQAGIPLDLPPSNPGVPGTPSVPSPEQPLPSAPGLAQPSNQPPAPGPAIPPSQRAVWDDHGRLQSYLAPGDTPAKPSVRNLYDASGERRIKQLHSGIEVLYVSPDYSITLYPDDDVGRDPNNPDNNSNLLTAAGQSAHVDSRSYNHHIRLDGQRITSLQRGLGYARPDCRQPSNPSALQPHHATWYATDHLGSTELQTDACGHLIARLAYFPWGQRWQEAHGTKDQGNEHTSPRHNLADPDTSYSGQQQDPESGLTQYSQRWYDPDLGIWLSTDPILDQYLQGKPNNGVYSPINLGLYAFANQNPIAFTDPSGKYGVVGHRLTPELVALAAGLPAAGATQIGIGSFAPDEDHNGNTDPRNAMSVTSLVLQIPSFENQKEIHLLNGEEALGVQNAAASDFDSMMQTVPLDGTPLTGTQQEIGHRMGDSQAHVKDGKMYSAPFGHAIDSLRLGKDPDNPHNAPERYEKYAGGMYDAMSKRATLEGRTPLLSKEETLNVINAISAKKDAAGQRALADAAIQALQERQKKP